MWHSLFGALSLGPAMAVDLGTANTVLYVKGKGIVAHEPSFVAFEDGGPDEGKIAAVGRRAKELRGRTAHNIQSISPLKEGAIQDFRLAGTLLRHLVSAAQKNRLIKSKVVVTVAANATAMERKALSEAAQMAGAGEVYMIDESLAAAIGAGLPVSEPRGSMLVDIGGGTTDVSVISLNGIVCSESMKTASNSFDRKIVDYVKRTYKLAIGEETAEQVKIKIGSALAGKENPTLEIKGQNITTALPATATITQHDVAKALTEPLEDIVTLIQRVFDMTPPEIAADLNERGIKLVGGGAMLRGLDEYLAERLSIGVSLVEEPLMAVAKGAGAIVESWESYGHLAMR